MKRVSRSHSEGETSKKRRKSSETSSNSEDEDKIKAKKIIEKKKRRHSVSHSSDSSSESRKKKHKRKKSKKHKKEKKKSKDKKRKDSPEAVVGPEVPEELLQKSKNMAPMTKEEWEKQQSVVKRVYDEETGRHRLIKGTGEVLEEIVSKDMHKQINKQATVGDGNYFQAKLSSQHM